MDKNKHISLLSWSFYLDNKRVKYFVYPKLISTIEEDKEGTWVGSMCMGRGARGGSQGRLTEK